MTEPVRTTDRRDLLRESLAAIDRLQARLDASEAARREPIAIVGLGCRYPGASNPQEFWELLRDGRIAAPWKGGAARAIRVHGHCHQKAFGTFDATLELLRTVPGADVAAIESSCCGMAGAFGHEKGHYEVSMKMGEAALLPAVRAAPAATTISAAGTSCRQQILDGTGRIARHPLTLLAELL